jgi:hypothetical protein
LSQLDCDASLTIPTIDTPLFFIVMHHCDATLHSIIGTPPFFRKWIHAALDARLCFSHLWFIWVVQLIPEAC